MVVCGFLLSHTHTHTHPYSFLPPHNRTSSEPLLLCKPPVTSNLHFPIFFKPPSLHRLSTQCQRRPGNHQPVQTFTTAPSMQPTTDKWRNTYRNITYLNPSLRPTTTQLFHLSNSFGIPTKGCILSASIRTVTIRLSPGIMLEDITRVVGWSLKVVSLLRLLPLLPPSKDDRHCRSRSNGIRKALFSRIVGTLLVDTHVDTHPRRARLLLATRPQNRTRTTLLFLYEILLQH